MIASVCFIFSSLYTISATSKGPPCVPECLVGTFEDGNKIEYKLVRLLTSYPVETVFRHCDAVQNFILTTYAKTLVSPNGKTLRYFGCDENAAMHFLKGVSVEPRDDLKRTWIDLILGVMVDSQSCVILPGYEKRFWLAQIYRTIIEHRPELICSIHNFLCNKDNLMNEALINLQVRDIPGPYLEVIKSKIDAYFTKHSRVDFEKDIDKNLPDLMKFINAGKKDDSYPQNLHETYQMKCHVRKLLRHTAATMGATTTIGYTLSEKNLMIITIIENVVILLSFVGFMFYRKVFRKPRGRIFYFTTPPNWKDEVFYTI